MDFVFAGGNRLRCSLPVRLLVGEQRAHPREASAVTSLSRKVTFEASRPPLAHVGDRFELKGKSTIKASCPGESATAVGSD